MKVNIALLTVTDTRTLDTDKSGAILVEKIKKANHNLVDRKICIDSKNEIIQILNQWAEKKEIDVIYDTKYGSNRQHYSVDSLTALLTTVNNTYTELFKVYNINYILFFFIYSKCSKY